MLSDIPKAQDQLFDPHLSMRQKYASLVVGRPGWGALLRYELTVLLGQATPGALGLAIRKALYPGLLASCGRNVVFGQNVVLRHPNKIRIGGDVVIDDNCLVDAKGDGNAGIAIGRGVFIGRNTILSCKNGEMSIGDGANIGFNCEIFSASRVVVGPGALLAAYTYVIGGDHDFSDPHASVLSQSRRSQGVVIGEGVWTGAGAKILDGVRVGDHAIVGAGAVVREDVPDYAIAVGIPARVVGSRRG
ncbi:MAG TPA: acyltransferase [Vicinamibacterales bacterium]|jgi:acetyltransferase-like isoleucine patch superfamily enzyme